MFSPLADASVPPASHSSGRPPAAAFHTITARDIRGQHTDFVLHRFADRVCLFITQFERIANVFVVPANTLHAGVGVKTFRRIEHRFGTDTDEIQAAIRHVIGAVPALDDCPVDVVLTLSLRTCDAATVRELVAVLNELM